MLGRAPHLSRPGKGGAQRPEPGEPEVVDHQPAAGLTMAEHAAGCTADDVTACPDLRARWLPGYPAAGR